MWLPQLHPGMFILLILLHTWDLSCYITWVCSYLWRWVLVVQLCLTLCDPMSCSPPGPSVIGISQARILERIAIPHSRRSSQPRAWPQVSWVAGRFFTIWATREAHWRAIPGLSWLNQRVWTTYIRLRRDWANRWRLSLRILTLFSRSSRHLIHSSLWSLMEPILWAKNGVHLQA